MRLPEGGAAPANKIEVKLIDASGSNVWWWKREAYAFTAAWQTLTIRSSEVEFAWGPAGGGTLQALDAVEIAIVAGPGGSGTVTSTPAGIDCGATCGASFSTGSTVALTATASADSTFGGWAGDCTGTGACSVTMSAARSVTATFKPASTIPRLANISTRMQVLTGNDVMIGGFVIQGTQPQTVIVRARGPSLAAFGILNFLANPSLQLFSGSTVIASNDDWQSASNAAQIQSLGFAPSDTRESAILITLNPGAYTAVVSGVGGTTGVGLVEVFAQ